MSESKSPIPKEVIRETIERRKHSICTLRFVRGEFVRAINRMIAREKSSIRYQKAKLKQKP
jgi:hypothetical protein